MEISVVLGSLLAALAIMYWFHIARLREDMRDMRRQWNNDRINDALTIAQWLTWDMRCRLNKAESAFPFGVTMEIKKWMPVVTGGIWPGGPTVFRLEFRHPEDIPRAETELKWTWDFVEANSNLPMTIAELRDEYKVKALFETLGAALEKARAPR